MNLRFTPSALALALALSAISVAFSDVDANGAGALADRFSGGEGTKKAARRRAERMFPLDASDVEGAVVAGSGEFDAADAGILERRRFKGKRFLFGDAGGRRSLQDDAEEEEATCLMPDTCEPSLCNCTANGGIAYDCASELDALCNNVTAADGTVFTVRGCVNYADYYYNLYCPFAKCVVDGGTEEECSCEFYNTSCELYDTRKYKYDEDVIQHCAADLCCQDKTDDVGRALCLEDAPTSSPSVDPSGPPGSSPADASAPGIDAAIEVSSAESPFSLNVVSAAIFSAAAAVVWLN